MMRILLAGFFAMLATLAQANSDATWHRGVDRGVLIGAVTTDVGTFLGFFCAPSREPKLSFLLLRPAILTNPIHYDEKVMDMRFVIDGERFDLPGKAEDGELYIENKDYNLTLQFERIIAALIDADNVSVAIPVKHWSEKIPVDGASEALDGLLAPCL